MVRPARPDSFHYASWITADLSNGISTGHPVPNRIHVRRLHIAGDDVNVPLLADHEQRFVKRHAVQIQFARMFEGNREVFGWFGDFPIAGFWWVCGCNRCVGGSCPRRLLLR